MTQLWLSPEFVPSRVTIFRFALLFTRAPDMWSVDSGIPVSLQATGAQYISTPATRY
jgi:hypothetical protein